MTLRLPRGEAIKAGCLAVMIVLVAGPERVGILKAGVISVAHVGWLALAGYCLLRVLRRPLPGSVLDALAVCYVSGWSTIGVFGLAAYGLGRAGPEVPVVLLAGLLLTRFVGRPSAGDRPPPIPWGVYVAALAYVAVSVVLPFACFSDHSISREFYGDGVQRFGVIHALADRVPPSNPFMSGMPMRYYWLGMLPYAVEVRWICHDLFAVWKCGQTWTALLFIPALWFIVRNVSGCSRIAWMTMAFAFVFCSWEALLHPSLRGAAHELGRDPDMLMGILQPYSDQLLMEDFLYIPQTAWALMAVLVSVWLLAEGHLWGALPGLATVAAANTFYLIPAAAGCAVLVLARHRLATAVCGVGAFIGLAVGGLALTGVLPVTGLGGIPAAAVLAGAGYALRQPVRELPPRCLAEAALALLVALAMLLLARPAHSPLAYLLNYGPPFVLGAFMLLRVRRRQEQALPSGLQAALLFLLVASATVLLLGAVFVAADVTWLPPSWQQLSARLGDLVNPFNFYHKTAKLVRLTWALLGALALAPLLSHWRSRRPWALGLGVVLLLASAVTAVWRPLTYAFATSVPEAAAARYLVSQHADMNTVVLAEDFRGTELNMLAPVAVYCYSQWGNGNMGLNTRGGTWLDQYLPPNLRPLSRQRELAVERFFSPDADTAQRAALLRGGRIAYVLTRQPWSTGGLAREVLSSDGVHLYRVLDAGERQPLP